MPIIKTKLWSEDFATLFPNEPIGGTDTIETYTLNPFSGKYERAGITGGIYYNAYVVPMVQSIGKDTLRQSAGERRRFFEEHGLTEPYISRSNREDPFSDTSFVTRARGKEWIPLIGIPLYWHRLAREMGSNFKTTYKDYLNGLIFEGYHLAFALSTINGIIQGAKKVFS